MLLTLFIYLLRKKTLRTLIKQETNCSTISISSVFHNCYICKCIQTYDSDTLTIISMLPRWLNYVVIGVCVPGYTELCKPITGMCAIYLSVIVDVSSQWCLSCCCMQWNDIWHARHRWCVISVMSVMLLHAVEWYMTITCPSSLMYHLSDACPLITWCDIITTDGMWHKDIWLGLATAVSGLWYPRLLYCVTLHFLWGLAPQLWEEMTPHIGCVYIFGMYLFTEDEQFSIICVTKRNDQLKIFNPCFTTCTFENVFKVRK